MLLNIVDTVSLLEKYVLPTPKSFFSNDVGELVKESSKMQFPLVLKIVSSEAIHKTEKGLVILGINNEVELNAAYLQLIRSVGKISYEYLMLQEQKKGVELIIGGKKDSQFGETLAFGTGGIYTELFKDVSFRVCPLEENDAGEMIRETKAANFLTGFRNKKFSEKPVTDILLKASKMFLENPEIQEFDFNPVIASEEGAWIVDARIIVK